MAKSVRITNIQTINDQIYVSYVYGEPPLGPVATAEISFGSEEDMKRNILAVEQAIGEEGLVKLALACYYVNKNGTLNNVNQVTNKTLNLDVTAANPLRTT